MTLPPVMQIIFDEELWSAASSQALKQKLMKGGLYKELARQGRWSLEEYEYVDASRRSTSGGVANGTVFGVTPSGTLNPFSPVGKCFSQGCVEAITDEFIKTVGLYTEVAFLTDPLTTFFTTESERDDEEFAVLFRHLKVLERIAPLFQAQVLRVATPVHSYCVDCKQEMEQALTEATDKVIAGISGYKAALYGTKKDGFLLGLELPILQPEHKHPIILRTKITNSQAALISKTMRTRSVKSKVGRKLLRELMAKAVHREIDTIFFELDSARRLDSLLLVGSRSEALVISTLDKTAPKLSEIEDWEKFLYLG